MPLTDTQVAAVRGLLESGSWFKGLPGDIKDAFFRRATIRRIRKGEVIGVAQVPLDGACVILEGHVQMLRHYGDEDETLIHVAGPGSWIGVASLLGTAPLVTSVASTPGRVVLLTRAQFENLVREYPRFYRDLTAVLIAFTDAALTLLANTRELTSESRVCAQIAAMAEMWARDAPSRAGEPLSLPLSQAELARIVGISRQRLNAVLARLMGLGLLSASFRRIVIPDVGRLRAHALASMARPASPAPPARRPPPAGRA